METAEETRDEAIHRWIDAKYHRCCSCHAHPPCSFCMEGYSLELTEYLELLGFGEETDPEQEKVNAYDEAMKVL